MIPKITSIALFQFLRASQRLRAQPGFSSDKKTAAFFWQGAFIILPVAVLAVVSLISLRQDERTAETEARKRAAENVQSLARAMRVSVDEELHRYLALQNMWTMELHSESQPSMTTQGFPSKEVAADIAKWERDYPRFKLAELALPHGVILADGRQIEPPDFPATPVPPKWFVELTPDQKKLLEAMRAARTEKSFRKLSEAFRSSVKSETALSAWSLLVSKPENIIGDSEQAFPTETGVAFQEIACAQLLTATNAQLTSSLLQSVWWRVFNHPSFVSPHLLELAGGLTNRADTVLQHKFFWMQKMFGDESKVREQLATLRRLPGLSPWKKLWWSHWTADGSALAIFQPMTFLDYQGDPKGRQGYEIWFVPEDVAITICSRLVRKNFTSKRMASCAKYFPAFCSAEPSRNFSSKLGAGLSGGSRIPSMVICVAA